MKKIILYPIMLIALISLVLGATCNVYSTEAGTDQFNFTSVQNTTYNYTQYNSSRNYTDVLFVAMTTITPLANFTENFTETMNFSSTYVAGSSHIQLDGTWQLNYYNATDISIFNGSENVSDQFSYVAGASSISCNNVSLNNTLLTIVYERNFVKGQDNLVNGPGTICTLCSSMYQLNASTFAYGQDVGFRIRDSDINGNSWTTTWSETVRTCLSYSTIDDSTRSGISSAKSLVYAGLALIAVMILVTVAWGLIQIFKGGDAHFMEITILAIGGAVLIMLGYVIIYFVATALGG